MSNQSDRDSVASHCSNADVRWSQPMDWLEAEERLQDARAEKCFDANNREGAQYRQGQGRMAFRARSWIREHVYPERDMYTPMED